MNEITQLFKYRADHERDSQALLDGVVWTASPRSLNDPFEFLFGVDCDMSLEEVQCHNRAANISNYVQLQKDLAHRLRSDFDPCSGVFCLSERRDTSLMWTHYANGHAGFCIGYEVREDNDLGNGKCRAIKYGDFPRIGMSALWHAIRHKDETAQEIFDAMVFSKDINWAYEKEWRIPYKEKDQLVLVNYKPRSITFGMKMPESEKKAVVKRLESLDLDYWQAHMREDSYTMRIEPAKV